MTRRTVVPASAALALLLAACSGGDGPARAAFEVVDSAGVPTAVNSADATESAPAIQLVEDLRLGTIDGPETEQFVGLRQVVLDESGRLYLSDSGARTIRVFEEDGTFVRTIGRAGEGPGEFNNETLGIAVARDTLLVLDRFRLHAFDTGGEFLHSTQQELAGNEIASLFGAGDGAWFVGRSVIVRPPEEVGGATRDTVRVWPFDPATGEVGDPVVEVPGERRWSVPNGRLAGRWLTHAPHAAVGPNGRLYVTDGTAYAVTVHAADGRVVRRVRADLEPPPVSADAVEAAVERTRAYYDSLGGGFVALADAFEQAQRELGPAEGRPMTGRLVVAPDGSFLLERRDLDPDPHMRSSGDATTWDHIDREGRVIGRVVLAAGVRLQAFTGTHILTVERDELGVSYAVRYALQTSTRPPV